MTLNATDSKLESLCHEIVNGKRKLIEAQLTYKTGEIITAKYDGKNWTSLKISYKGTAINVPGKTLKKITEIHFQTLDLVWSSANEVAFNSSYFFIKFEMGTAKHFNTLPTLNINFKHRKFSNCVIWKAVEENSTQWSDF